ncbi:hypothetical protein M218_04535 [Burkholderia pseudomallei MSHR338]|nr:hypothetical protein M218_04535 [Burkholderia pseudomallei MSHR338]
MPLCLQGLGHLPQNTGLTHACVAAKFDIASSIEGLVHCCYALMSRKDDLAYVVVDVSERLAGMFCKGRTCACVPPVCREAKSARMQGLQKGRATSIPPVLGYADG